jgi:hypothetical protein
MPITTEAANKKTTAIADAFGDIGFDETGMPKSKANLDAVAWEVLVAKQLKSAAEAREGAAIKAAIKAGVMFDHKKNPHDAGTACVVYQGEAVRIDLAVGFGREGVNHDKYVALLAAAGVDPKLLARLALNCATVTAPPHSFSAVLVTK